MKKHSHATFVTGEGRASFLHVFEKAPTPNGEAIYSVAFLWPKSDTATSEMFKKAVADVVEYQFDGKRPPRFETGIHDGDEHVDKKGDAYADHWFVNLKARKYQPVIINELGKPVPCDGHNEPAGWEFRSGDYCRVKAQPYGYDNTTRGCSWGLIAIQKTREGERFGYAPRVDPGDFDDSFADPGLKAGAGDDFADDF